MLMIVNDAPYRGERTFKALRLADVLDDRKHERGFRYRLEPARRH
jgi:hypothetical protein